MQLTVLAKDLGAALDVVMPAVSSRGMMPILSAVKLSVNADGVSLFATDMETFIQHRIAAEVGADGVCCVDARKLAEICKVADGDAPMTLSRSPFGVRVETPAGAYDLTTYAVDDFPDAPAVTDAAEFDVSGPALAMALDAVQCAIPTKDPRRVLQGVHVLVGDGKCQLTATDGRRLARSVIEAETGEAEFIWPARGIAGVCKLAGDAGQLHLAVAGAQIIARWGATVYMTSRIEGQYPKADAVIPKQTKYTAEIQPLALVQALRRAAPLAEEKHHAAIVTLDKGGSRIATQSFETGQFDGVFPLPWEHEPLKIAFDTALMLSVLKAMVAEKMTMRIKDNASPVVFEDAGREGTLWLIMPVRMADLAKAEKEGEAA